MYKYRIDGGFMQEGQPENEKNQFMFETNLLNLQQPKLKGRLSIKSKFERDKLRNQTNPSVKPFNHNQRIKMKTQSNDRLRMKRLPDLIMKTPIGSIKHCTFDKSEKLIRSTTKNTQILNELIGILQDDHQPHPKLNKIKINSMSLKEKNNEKNRKNQFLQEQSSKVFLPSRPKVIQTEIMKVYQEGNVAKRDIYSQERTRHVPKKYNLKKNSLKGQTEQLMTFYNVKKRAYTESINEQTRTILANSQIRH